jgi:hypothetical protein
MPTLVVNGTGVPIFKEWIELDLWASWGGRLIERLATDERVHEVTFTGGNDTVHPMQEGGGDVRWPRFEVQAVEPLSTGIVELAVEVFMYRSFSNVVPAPVHDLLLEVSLDGEVLRSVDVEEEGELDSSEDYGLGIDLEVSPGFHRAEIVLTGIPDEDAARKELDRTNLSIARADASTPRDDIVEWLEEYYLYLVLDPDIRLVVGGSDISVGEYPVWGAQMVLFEGSSFTLRDVKGDEIMELDLYARGPGSLVIEDLDIPYLYVYSTDGWVRMADVSLQVMSAVMLEAEVRIDNLSAEIDWWVTANSTIRIDHSRIDCVHIDPWFMGLTDLTVVNSTFVGNSKYHYLYVGEANKTFVNTTFEDVSLRLNVWDGSNGTLTVADCEFSGEGAFLTFEDEMGGSNPPTTAGDVDVWGNRFVGPRAGIKAPEWMFNEVLAENELVNGAGLRVWYGTTVQLVSENTSFRSWDLCISPQEEAILDGGYFTVNKERVLSVLLTVVDFSSVDDPPSIHVVVTLGTAVFWFADVDLGTDEVTIEIPDWGFPLDSMRHLLRSYKWVYG